jgi:hypothetical protein
LQRAELLLWYHDLVKPKPGDHASANKDP